MFVNPDKVCSALSAIITATKLRAACTISEWYNLCIGGLDGDKSQKGDP